MKCMKEWIQMKGKMTWRYDGSAKWDPWKNGTKCWKGVDSR